MMGPREADHSAASRFLSDPSRGASCSLIGGGKRLQEGESVHSVRVRVSLSSCTNLERAALSPSLRCRAVCTTVRPEPLQETEEPTKHVRTRLQHSN